MEIELKFEIEAPAPWQKKLKTLGAKPVYSSKESDHYYDYKYRTISKNGCLLRLRKYSKGAFITLKSPVKKHYGRFKARDEFEIRVKKPEILEPVFRQAGLLPSGKKEKVRRTYEFKKTKVNLDKLPFLGYYIEIEGTKRGILETVKRLGLDINNGIKASYDRLFCDFYIRSIDSMRDLIGPVELTFKCEKKWKK